MECRQTEAAWIRLLLFTCCNKSRNNNYLDQHRVLNLDVSTYLYQEGGFPAIVSKEVWNKVQSIRLNRRKCSAFES